MDDLTPQLEGTPAVSVVVPTYRRPEMLRRAIDSVLEQTCSNWEVLVVDDNGVGTVHQLATADFMRQFETDPRIHYFVHDQNRGACAARNTGIREARAAFVAFLDDDDVWYRAKLQLQLDCFVRSSADVALVHGGYREVDQWGNVRLVEVDGRAHEWRALLMRNGIGTTSVVMCRREALLAVDGFDERLPSMQDYDLYLRLAQRYAFAWVDVPLLDKHYHAGAMIGKDVEGVLKANNVFYEKHRHLFEGDREVLHTRLRWFGWQALRAGRLAQGRGLLWRAWLHRPSDAGSLALALFANRLSLAVYRRTRPWIRRPRRGAAPIGNAAGSKGGT